MAKVFLCYRRDDTAAISGRVYDRLAARFGRRNVFKDIDSIPLGVDFRQHIEGVIRGCDGVIALIGRDWLTLRDAQGQRRIDDPEDYVRLEVETALTAGIPLIPLLVDGARMPAATDLPPGLAPLALRNGLELEVGRHFDDDIRRLIAAVESWGQSSRPRLWGARRNTPSTGTAQAPASTPDQLRATAPPATTAADTPEAKPPISVRRRWIALASAVLLVALALTLIAWPASPLRTLVFSGRAGATHTATRTATNAGGRTGASLHGVFVTSDGKEGWAVGVSNQIFHYMPLAGWKLQPLAKTYYLNAISMLPDGSDGWAVGNAGELLHYSGGQWKEDTSLYQNFNAVQERAANDVWAAGDKGVIAHFTGANWEVTPINTKADFFAISMVSTTQGWVAGNVAVGAGVPSIGDDGTYGLWRLEGGVWRPDRSGTLGNEIHQFTDVQMFSATDGVLATEGPAPAGEGHLWRFQNSRWTNVEDAGWLSNFTPVTLRLAMISATEGFAIGGMQMLHYAKNSWTQVGTTSPSGAPTPLRSIHAVSNDVAWVAGDSGLILKIDSTSHNSVSFNV